MADPDEALIEAIAEALMDAGAAPGAGIHSWRCEYPERYGPCDCVTETARDVLAAMVAHLGLVEERSGNCHNSDLTHTRCWTSSRRLVSRWTSQP